jgi:PilZ domain
MAGNSDFSGAEKSHTNAREYSRDAVSIKADLLLSEGPRFKVSVLDLSPAGFRIETANHILLNHIVYLTIPNFQPLQARVAWNYKEQYGCQLTRPMYGAVFAHIASAYPSLVAGNIQL